MNIFFFQFFAFREMVNLRYQAGMGKDVPLFRTIQYAWYTCAIYFTYAEAFESFVTSNATMQRYPFFKSLVTNHEYISFVLYVGLFVITTLSLKKGYYRYQMGQLAWTLVAIAMVVMQFQSALFNTLSGKKSNTLVMIKKLHLYLSLSQLIFFFFFCKMFSCPFFCACTTLLSFISLKKKKKKNIKRHKLAKVCCVLTLCTCMVYGIYMCVFFFFFFSPF